MITVEQYFRKPHSAEQYAAATHLAGAVRALVNEAVEAEAFVWRIDPDTGTCISGRAHGDGDGGFRTPGSKEGAPNSSHREGRGVDVFDPEDLLDKWLDKFESADGGNTKLAEHSLYREHPDATPGWCHLTTRAPASRRRTFRP